MCGLITNPKDLYDATVGLLPLDVIPGVGGAIAMVLKKFIIKLIKGFCQAVTGHRFVAEAAIQERRIKGEVKSALAKEGVSGVGGSQNTHTV